MTSNQKSRPTSPHLQIYRWNISSITSILHRLTGAALYLSILTISWFIVYYTYNPELISDSETCECLFNKIIKILFTGALICMTFCFYYHFCNGLRHLFWDIGKGLNLRTAKKTGYLSLLAALIMTIASFMATIYFKLF